MAGAPGPWAQQTGWSSAAAAGVALQRTMVLALTVFASACGSAAPSETGDGAAGAGDGADATADIAADTARAADTGASEDDAVAPGQDVTATDAVPPACVEASPCSDGDPCTVGDSCVAGACAPGVDLCVCKADADCAGRYGADLCVGTWYCDKTTAAGACKLVPGSKVVCDASLDTLCAQAVCHPATGKCAPQKQPDGIFCNDGDPCTEGDACQAGACAPGWPLAACECKSDADCPDDGNLCNGKPYCAKATFPPVCKINPATVVTCAASDAVCQANVCDPASGSCQAKPVADLTPCDDGKPTTAGDACVGGACQGAELGMCGKDSDCTGQEDGNVCNGKLYCHLATKTCKVNPATVITCPSVADTACLASQCQPVTGQCLLLPANEGKGCDDGDACTEGDHCQAGACLATADTCLCSKNAECAKAEDGNFCNGTMFCNLSTKPHRCQPNPASVVLCPTVDDTNCRKNACVPLSGACTATATELTVAKCDPLTGVCRREQRPAGEVGPKASCDDGDGCTAGDSCADGVCQKGTPVCVCSNDAECKGKSDGDLCKGAWYCDNSSKYGVCKPNPANAIVCPSVNDSACVKAKCEPSTGQCKPTLVGDGTPCEDGEPCTEGTLCVQGTCKAGAVVCECIQHADCEASKGDGDLCNGVLYCDKSGSKPQCKLNPASVVECPPNAGSVCLKSVCNPATGFCNAKAHSQGKACDDGSVCSVDDACDGGLCVGVKNGCNDNNACTADSCVSGQGCVHAAKPCDDGNACTVESCNAVDGSCKSDGTLLDGKLCDADGTPCTQGDACKAGSCKAGVAVACAKPANPCLEAQCIGVTALESKCVAVPKADGTACDDVSVCYVGSTCSKGECQAGPKGKIWQSDMTVPWKVGNSTYSIDKKAVIALLPAADGGVLVLFRGGNVTGGTSVFIANVAATGEIGTPFSIGGAGDADDRVRAVRRADGGVVVTANTGTSSKPVMYVLDPSGKLLTSIVPAAYRLSDISAAGERVTVAGRTNSSPWIQQMNSELATLWGWQGAGGPAGAVATSAVVTHASGEVTVVVATTTGSVQLPEHLVRLTAQGKVAWTRTIDNAGMGLKGTETQRIREATNGRFLLVGQQQPTNGSTMMMAILVDPAKSGGDIKLSVGYTNSIWLDAAVATDGSFAIAGYAMPFGTDKSSRSRWELRSPTGKFLLGTDGTGAESAGDSSWSAVTALPGGRFLFAGLEGPAKALRLKVVSAFGQGSCAAAGACYGLAATACDDGEKCTDDTCAASSGCTHAPISGCN